MCIIRSSRTTNKNSDSDAEEESASDDDCTVTGYEPTKSSAAISIETNESEDDIGASKPIEEKGLHFESVSKQEDNTDFNDNSSQSIDEKKEIATERDRLDSNNKHKEEQGRPESETNNRNCHLDDDKAKHSVDTCEESSSTAKRVSLHSLQMEKDQLTRSLKSNQVERN